MGKTTGVVKCKNAAKLKVTVRSSKDPKPEIDGAKVTLKRAGKKQLIGRDRPPSSATLDTQDGGTTTFDVKAGSGYTLEVTADGKPRGQSPRKPFEPFVKQKVVLKKGDNTLEVDLTPVPIVRVFLALRFTDPEGNERAFPPDVEAAFKFAEGTPLEVKTLAGGVLTAAAGDGQPGVPFDARRGAFELELSSTRRPRYVVCEKRGDPQAETEALDQNELDSLLGERRAFLLPPTKWTLGDAAWTVSDDGGTWIADQKKFGNLDGKEEVGGKDAPVKLLLDPRWQFLRLTYHDRIKGAAEQISILPVLLDGHEGAEPTTPRRGSSNWTFGDDDTKAVQCLPWILTKGAKPDKDSLVRFTQKKNTFIHTADDGKRRWSKNKHDEANAERLRYYDLPEEWRCTNWFVRKKPLGKDTTGGVFWWELDTDAKLRATKDAPLVLSLDDMVLVRDDLEPVSSLPMTARLAVFKHTFAKDGDADLSDEGLFLPEAEPTPETGQDMGAVFWPASKHEVIARSKASGGPAETEPGAPRAKLLENYVFKYPDWTRLILADGSAYDVFSRRSVGKDGKARVVGARAAVRWVDAKAKLDDVGGSGVPKGKHQAKPGLWVSPRPKAVDKPFFSQQQLLATDIPVGNARRDADSASGKGTASSATDIGGLSASRVGRASDRVKEWQAEARSGGQIGRNGVILLRCCGRDATDKEKERAVLFQWFRLGVDFKSPNLNTPAPQKEYIQRQVTNLLRRWNGPDGAFNVGRPLIEPRDPSKPPGKLAVEVLRFFQNSPIDRADIRTDVVERKDGERDFMDSWHGVTQSQEDNEKPAGDGWFTAAHEMGHGGALLDDYCELWNHASFNQPGLPGLMPGDPYMLDDIGGAESIMKANKVVRPRNAWHLAEWVHARLGAPVQVLHPADTKKPYFLPHHRTTARTKAELRSHLTYCWDSVLDIALPDGKGGTLAARCDAYLYPLGVDEYSETILKDLAGASSGFDGILVVAVHIGCDFKGFADHDQVRAMAAKVVSSIRAVYGQRVHAELTCGGHELKRCLVHVSPRVLVGTYTTNEDYKSQIDVVKVGDVQGWPAFTFVSQGDLIVEGGYLYECGYVNPPTPPNTQNWTDNTKPAFPQSKNASVDELDVRWTCLGKADRALYRLVIARKARQNQLHTLLITGVTHSDLHLSPGELPRIRVKTVDLSQIADALAALGGVAKTAFADLLTDRDAKGQEAVNKKNEVDAKVLEMQNKQGEINGLGPPTPANQAQRNQLAGELQTIVNDGLALEAAFNQLVNEYRVLEAEYEALHAALQLQLIESAGPMLDGLFQNPDDPLTDADYTALQGKPGLAATAAAAPQATRDTVAASVGTGGPAIRAVPTAVKVLRPHMRPASAAAVVQKLADVAKKVHDFAASGSDAKEKFERTKQGRETVVHLTDVARRFLAKIMADNKAKIDANTLTEHRVHEWAVENDKLPWSIQDAGRADTAASIEEQVQVLFGQLLGLEHAAGSTKGWAELVKPFADDPSKVTVSLNKPAPPPVTPPPAPPPPPPVVTAKAPSTPPPPPTTQTSFTPPQNA